MPTKGQILQHWRRSIPDLPIDEKTCWACGFAGVIHRAHIRDRCEGGSDEAENLMLLCRQCHYTQESVCQTPEGRERWIAAIADGSPFMGARLAYLKTAHEILHNT